MRPHPFTIVALVGALLGLAFAAVSTFDFAQHLDRQVHEIHCSFIPGLEGEDPTESGCQVTMMSPYSSVLRGTLWGGVPISLPAMAVFAFLLFFAGDLALSRREENLRATSFFGLAALLPALTSLVMAYISIATLDATCKLCIGIYVSSALVAVGAGGLWFRARQLAKTGAAPPRSRSTRKKARPAPKPASRDDDGADPAWVSASGAPEQVDGEESEPVERAPGHRPHDADVSPIPLSHLALAFGIGVLFVLVSVGSYVAAAPDHDKYIGACGSLPAPEDEYGVIIDLGGDGVKALEILDPLCPACRGFEERLATSGLEDRFHRQAILFPLDNTCNWMVNEAIHPGACTVSEAVLCAGDDARKVIDWAFANQDEIRSKTAENPGAAARMAKEQFPELASCIGSNEVESKLNKSLRWAVNNNIRVLTPQLFVNGVKLCDEDVDLGLEFALTRMLELHASGKLKPTTPEQPADGEPSGDTEPQRPAPATATPDTGPAPTGDTPAGQAEPAAPSDEPATNEPGAGDPPGETGDSPGETGDSPGEAGDPQPDDAPDPGADEPASEPSDPQPDNAPDPGADEPASEPSDPAPEPTEGSE